jgi:cytochrome c oxidase subunit II
MRHFVIVGILIIALTLLTYSGLSHVHLMPVEASTQSGEIDWMWDAVSIGMAFLFALIVVPMGYSLIVFRRKKGDTSDAEHVEGNTRLEIAWTVVPLIIVVIYSVLGAKNLADVVRAAPDAMVIKVTAFQWGWTFEYPEYGGFTSPELYLPVNKPVHLEMTSTDVIHSFWVPEFRVKQDLVPGRTTELQITPTLDGNYKVRCSELCGTGHYKMEQPVVVVNTDQFTAWVADQQALALKQAATPEGRGQKIYQTYCKACHSIDGSVGIAPTWRGLYGSQVKLSDGSTVTANDQYILNSIKNPESQVVNGFQPMSFHYQAAGITDDQLNDILAYIKTLK